MSLLELERVGRRHRQGAHERVVLRDVSLRLDRGELVAVWGLRRSGRSTLLRVAAGIEAPGQRRRALRGRGSGRERRRRARRRDRLLPARAGDEEGRGVLEQLLIAPARAGHPPVGARTRALEALARAGAERCAARTLRELDGAETVRVTLARALALGPALLVIDEPTVGVDLLERDGILALLRSLADEGLAVLIATGEAAGLSGADRALSLAEGELRGSAAARARAGAAAAPARERVSACTTSGPAHRRPTVDAVSMLELERVVKRYRRGAGEHVHAVDGVSLRLEPGEMLALHGPSGSGKTTLLLLIATLLRPDRGAIRFDGRDLASLSERQACDYLHGDVGFVYQSPQLMPRVSALENACIKLVLGGVGTREAQARALPWLERVGIGANAQQTPEQLSGGERQRVAIARALVGEPRLILADEPTGNLDSARSREIVELLHAIAHERGAAVLLVTHDLEAASIADRHCTLRDGRLCEGDPGAPGEGHPGEPGAPGGGDPGEPVGKPDEPVGAPTARRAYPAAARG